MIFRRYGAPPSSALIDSPLQPSAIGPGMIMPRQLFSPTQLIASSLTAGVRPAALFRTPASTPVVETVAPTDSGSTRILFARPAFEPIDAPTRTLLLAPTPSGGTIAASIAPRDETVTATKPSATQLVSSVRPSFPAASGDSPEADEVVPDATEEKNRTDILSIAPTIAQSLPAGLIPAAAPKSNTTLYVVAGLGIAAFLFFRK
jgi:hypothetical protein